ncbi:methyltransferase domain-containing protein [Variovorax sp. J22P271]|uniref:class I SAM-dependent methyltransferase n=1 Tax=Variovorax davisae TaxID=3053515 RepID=UPI002574A925|nr:methyltransferase domain-containing protein [Variovorax sp. J22P271]MDM0030593.1 methyltransferase domain-containing protein [Variovorax sp. J22P271]
MNSISNEHDYECEEALTLLWAELLEMNLADVRSDTDFFKAGGHSLSAMLLIARVQKGLGKLVPLFALVENPTPATLAQYISNMGDRKIVEEPKAPDGSASQTERLLGYNNEERRDRRNAWFDKYYSLAITSAAHAEFCRRIYGENFGQHGMADFVQIDQLLAYMKPIPGDVVLDLGCGYGLISEYIFKKTGASVVGVDLAPKAIAFAQTLAERNSKLRFHLMDIQNITFPAGTFSHIVSIDTIYYATSTKSILEKFIEIGQPAVKVGILRTFPIRTFTKETWHPDRTELAVLLSGAFGGYHASDLSKEENEHWRKKVQVLETLRDDFIKEGNQELYEFRYKEAKYEAGIEQFRYMFVSERSL